MQQSAAFKILRTRLKTVPTYSFSGGGQISRASSGVPFSQYIHHREDGGAEDNNINNSHQGINFAARLQQFENVQNQHRGQTRNKVNYSYNTSSSSASKVHNATHIFFFNLKAFICNRTISQFIAALIPHKRLCLLFRHIIIFYFMTNTK